MEYLIATRSNLQIGDKIFLRVFGRDVTISSKINRGRSGTVYKCKYGDGSAEYTLPKQETYEVARG